MSHRVRAPASQEPEAGAGAAPRGADTADAPKQGAARAPSPPALTERNAWQGGADPRRVRTAAAGSPKELGARGGGFRQNLQGTQRTWTGHA